MTHHRNTYQYAYYKYIHIYIYICTEVCLKINTQINTNTIHLNVVQDIYMIHIISSGLAGVSSGVRLGDGWLVCSALLLVWPKLELIVSIGRILSWPKNNPPPHPTTSTSTSTTTTKTTPISKRSRARFPPGSLRCCCACWLGCWLLAVGLLLLLLLLLVVLLAMLLAMEFLLLALGL